MKIATWNINSVRIRISLLKLLVSMQKPDIILLQETKVEDQLFPYQLLVDLGYDHVYYTGEKSYNGVAILSKIPADSHFVLEFYNTDKRHIAIKLGDIEIHNFYIPAGGDIPDIDENPKFKHKLAYVALMQDWFLKNRDQNDKIILGGDLNIAPLEHDVWSSKQLRNVVSHTDVERAAFINLQTSLGLVDSCRYFVPQNQKFYTWWSYRSPNWELGDRGRKLDHILVSANLKNRLTAVQALKQARGFDRPSDHVPYILEIADA